MTDSMSTRITHNSSRLLSQPERFYTVLQGRMKEIGLLASHPTDENSYDPQMGEYSRWPHENHCL